MGVCGPETNTDLTRISLAARQRSASLPVRRSHSRIHLGMSVLVGAKERRGWSLEKGLFGGLNGGISSAG